VVRGPGEEGPGLSGCRAASFVRQGPAGGQGAQSWGSFGEPGDARRPWSALGRPPAAEPPAAGAGRGGGLIRVVGWVQGEPRTPQLCAALERWGEFVWQKATPAFCAGVRPEGSQGWPFIPNSVLRCPGPAMAQQRVLPQSKETLLQSYNKRLKDDVKSIMDNFTEIIKTAKVSGPSQPLSLRGGAGSGDDGNGASPTHGPWCT
jgi:hypothetical protein